MDPGWHILSLLSLLLSVKVLNRHEIMHAAKTLLKYDTKPSWLFLDSYCREITMLEKFHLRVTIFVNYTLFFIELDVDSAYSWNHYQLLLDLLESFRKSKVLVVLLTKC